MQHVVFGAGLIGGYVAGAMLHQGMNVSLVARPSVQEKLHHGVKLTDYLDNSADVSAVNFIPPDVLTGSRGSYACDFLWLTVKCTAVESAIADIDALVGPDTVIFCVQNGLGSEQVVKAKYPNNTVLRVMVMFNVAEPSAGHLHRGSEGHVSIEALQDNPVVLDVVSDIAKQMNCPLLPTESCIDMDAMLWAKLQLNLANAVNALADIPVKQMIEDRNYRRVIALLMNELLAVVAAQNITLPKIAALPNKLIPSFIRMPNFLFALLGQQMLAIDPTVRTSMWWDLSGGKLTEVDYLNGAVVQHGERLGVPCPANNKLVAMIHQAEQGEIKQGIAAADLLAALN